MRWPCVLRVLTLCCPGWEVGGQAGRQCQCRLGRRRPDPCLRRKMTPPWRATAGSWGPRSAAGASAGPGRARRGLRPWPPRRGPAVRTATSPRWSPAAPLPTAGATAPLPSTVFPVVPTRVIFLLIAFLIGVKAAGQRQPTGL